MEKFESEERKKVYNQALDELIKSIYLLALYLTGGDEYDEFCYYNKEEKRSKENFLGVRNWNGMIHEYINELESEGYLELSTTKKSLCLTKKAIKKARDILREKKIDFSAHADILLADQAYHDDYIQYKTPRDESRERVEE